jgi:hypothetical protein
MLTAERLRELLTYDPETGIFTWRCDRGGKARKGTRAGSVSDDGYARIGVDGKSYLAHRLAWLYTHGSWPAAEIDHRLGAKADNRIHELREATHAQNLQNQRRARSDSRSGLLGVSRRGNRWRATIKHQGRYRHLGSFDAKEAAHEFYLLAKEMVHPFGASQGD